VRHAGDIARLAMTKWSVASHVASRILFGSPVTDAAPVADSNAGSGDPASIKHAERRV